MKPGTQTKAELRAERDHYRELAEKGLEPRMKRLRFEDGQFDAEVTGEAVEYMALIFVSHFKEMGAENYFEMNLTDRAEPFQRYTVTVQKVGALSPGEKAAALERRIAELEATAKP